MINASFGNSATFTRKVSCHKSGLIQLKTGSKHEFTVFPLPSNVFKFTVENNICSIENDWI